MRHLLAKERQLPFLFSAQSACAPRCKLVPCVSPVGEFAATNTSAWGRSRPTNTQAPVAKSPHRHTNSITQEAACRATGLVGIGFAFGWRIDRARLAGEGQVEDSATSLVDAPHGRSRYRDYPEGGGLLERSPPRRRELAATRTIPGDGPSGVASVACSRPGPMTVGAGAIGAG
jgi:hypothetical protein